MFETQQVHSSYLDIITKAWDSSHLKFKFHKKRFGSVEELVEALLSKRRVWQDSSFKGCHQELRMFGGKYFEVEHARVLPRKITRNMICVLISRNTFQAALH